MKTATHTRANCVLNMPCLLGQSEAARVISAEHEGGLGEVVGAEAEEVCRDRLSVLGARSKSIDMDRSALKSTQI